MAHDWLVEDIRALNPPESPQSVGFLDRLLKLSATSEELLIESAKRLEGEGVPYVLAFGQLPFDLGLGPLDIEAPGDNPTTTVDLSAFPVQLRFDAYGRLVGSQNDSTPSAAPIATVTQLVGRIRLSHKRARAHPLYCARLANLRLLSAPLGDHMVESWMRLPEASLSEPTRRRRPLTGTDFQREVAARARDHLCWAARALLEAYGVAALVNMRGRDFLFGFHIMIAPGRLATAGIPVPVLNGLVARRAAPVGLTASLGDIRDVIKTTRRGDDPFVQRLQALNSLVRGDEPELALVGCCTALEWFLNQRYPDLTYKRRSGELRTGNLRTFLDSTHSGVLDLGTRAELTSMVTWRNDVAHGSPPARSDNEELFGVAARARSALHLALRVYRIVNSASANAA